MKKDVEVVQHKNRFVSVFTESQYFLKGGPLIVSAAKKFPEITFIVVGMNKEDDDNIPENLRFVGRKTPEELKVIYSESQFYMQLSNFEGFGVSLCEAMLCGCIPVVSSVNILPEIVVNAGFVLGSDTVDELTKVINRMIMLKDLDSASANCRKQIVDNYTLVKREKEIVKIIEAR
jgi:glycosyltransferase involved in cell wall biosynthesis